MHLITFSLLRDLECNCNYFVDNWNYERWSNRISMKEPSTVGLIKLWKLQYIWHWNNYSNGRLPSAALPKGPQVYSCKCRFRQGWDNIIGNTADVTVQELLVNRGRAKIGVQVKTAEAGACKRRCVRHRPTGQAFYLHTCTSLDIFKLF